MKKLICKIRGFTIIELMVVAAILLILAGIALPIIKQVKEKRSTSISFDHNSQKELVISKIKDLGYENIVLSPGGGYFDFYADKGNMVYRIKYTYDGKLISVTGVNLR